MRAPTSGAETRFEQSYVTGLKLAHALSSAITPAPIAVRDKAMAEDNLFILKPNPSYYSNNKNQQC
jgi:hypothetical protein